MDKKIALGVCVGGLTLATFFVSRPYPVVGAPNDLPGTPVFLPAVLREVTDTPTPTPSDTPTNTPTPIPSMTPTNTATNTSVPPGVYVVGSIFAFQDLLNVHVVGEVQNDTGGPVELVHIAAKLYSDSHQLEASDSNYTYLTHLPAGDTTCFDVQLSIPVQWSSAEVDSPTYFSSNQGLPEISVAKQIVYQDPQFHFYDMLLGIQNDGPSPVNGVFTVATLYDAEGNPRGCNFGYSSPSNLSPSQQGSLEIKFE